MVVIGAVNGKSDHIFIEVRLGDTNGKEQLALFDTGTRVSILKAELARSLGKKITNLRFNHNPKRKSKCYGHCRKNKINTRNRRNKLFS